MPKRTDIKSILIIGTIFIVLLPGSHEVGCLFDKFVAMMGCK